MEFYLRGEKAMNFRFWKWFSVLLVVLVVLLQLNLLAQETLNTEEPEKNARATAQEQKVPEDISKKAREYKGSPSPPKQLIKQADGHWTPYNPPAIKEGDYIIQQGDTLSTLAQQKLGNWLLWPLIWDMNPYITDAHWIYPGDPLSMPERPKVIGQEGEGEGEEEEAGGPKGPEMIIEEEANLPPINAKDIYCSGFITDKFKMPSLKIASSASRIKESLGEGDIVYLNGGKNLDVVSGGEYFIINEGPPVYHSVSGKYMGKLYEKIGRIKVLCVQEKTSIAKITLSCDEVKYGMALLPFSPIPMPWNIRKSETLPLCEQQSDKVKGKIIWSEDRRESVGEHSIIYADFGANQKIMPGDKFWIYRYSAVEDTLVGSITDLFKQQQMTVAGKDLFRESKSLGKVKNPNKEIAKQKKKDSRLPEGAQITQSQTELNELQAKKGDSRLPSDVTRVESTPEEGISSIRKYVGEAVVISTQGDTSCLKIINTAEEVKLSDTLELE